jgi:hypothetical protein
LASRHGPRWLADGSHPPLGLWISPSPWEGREERAGRAFSFSSIHRGPFRQTSRYGMPRTARSFLLSDPP